MTPFRLIDSPESLAEAAASLAAGTGPVAVDAERASGFRYSNRAYLVQFFRRGSEAFLVDPITAGDLTPVQQAIGAEEWVFHAASQDLPSLREVGLDPARIFDTELAARLLGWERVGLGAVVERTLGITLAKEHSAADWSTRPLPTAWLDYAALDVLHLVDVRDEVADALEQAGKSEFARQEFEAVLNKPVPEPRAEPWRRLSGLHKVRGARNLAVARELWLARDAYAQEIDTAPGRLIPDRSLIVAVLSEPTSKQKLASMRDFIGRASRTQLDRWWQAIERGRATTDLPIERVASDALPPHRVWADKNPAADARLRRARPLVEQLAETLQMPTENLLTPETLRRISWTAREPFHVETIAESLAAHEARPWQIDLTAQAIADAFVVAAQRGAEDDETGS